MGLPHVQHVPPAELTLAAEGFTTVTILMLFNLIFSPKSPHKELQSVREAPNALANRPFLQSVAKRNGV